MSPKEILVVDDEWDEVEYLTLLLVSERHPYNMHLTDMAPCKYLPNPQWT